MRKTNTVELGELPDMVLDEDDVAVSDEIEDEAEDGEDEDFPVDLPSINIGNEEEGLDENEVEIPSALIERMADVLGKTAEEIVEAMREATTPQENLAPIVLDPKTNDYREATPEEQELIAAGEMVLLEPEDKGNPDLLQLGPGYDQGFFGRFHYRWCNIRPEFRTGELGLGYVPVKKSADGKHPVKMVPGIGECVTVGDLILMKVPREVAERRLKAFDKERLAEQRYRMKAVKQHLHDKADDFGDDVELFEENFSTKTDRSIEFDPEYRNDGSQDFGEVAAEAYKATIARIRGQKESDMRASGELPRSKVHGFRFNPDKVDWETSKDRQIRERANR